MKNNCRRRGVPLIKFINPLMIIPIFVFNKEKNNNPRGNDKIKTIINNNKVCFRCLRKNYKSRYSITVNSFFNNFTNLNAWVCIEIIKTNLCFKYNIKTRKKDTIISDKVIKIIRKVFHKIREIFINTYFIISNWTICRN